MKKSLNLRPILIVAFCLTIFMVNGCSFIEAVKQSVDETKKSFDERYGSGTSSDITKNINNFDKLSTLAPYYTKINTMFDDGKITAQERDRRKNELSSAYDKMKKGSINSSQFYAKCRELSR